MQKKLPTASTSDSRNWGWSRPQQPPILLLTKGLETFRKNRCSGGRRAGRCSRQPQETSTTKRNQARLTAQLNLLRQKQFISTIHQVLNHGMLWGVGLNQHLSWSLSSAGTTCQLKKQLQGLFSSTKVGSMQQSIGSQDSRQGDTRQVHTLREHLRSNQHVGLTSRKTIQQAAMSIAATGGIAIEPQQTQAFQLFREELQHPLRPSTERLECC
jgi:hypothetical protein